MNGREQHTAGMVDGSASVFWLTGLSGAGKTTIGDCLGGLFAGRGQKAIRLDGDDLRPIFGATGDHSIETRVRLGIQYAQLSRLIAGQGTCVIWSSVSMFPEVYDWAAANIPNYIQVYVRAPIEVVVRRDTKGLYRQGAAGEISDVVGLDIELNEPPAPHLVVDSDGSRTPDDLAAEILAFYDTRTKC